MSVSSIFPIPGGPERNIGQLKIVDSNDPVISNLLFLSDTNQFPIDPFDDQGAEMQKQISTGAEIEAKLIELASIGGSEADPIPEQPERYATNRLALSENDYEARRNFIQPMMVEAGLEVEEHPLADIGVLRGTNSDLPPLVLASHTDTVPGGDMYDGVYGVISAIEVIESMGEIGFTPDRDIIVLSYTGEESARFGMACFGSKGIFHGLTKKELESRENPELGGKSIGEILGPEKSKLVMEPMFGKGRKFKTPYSVLELHVEQSDLLEKNRIDIGVVENIAAPARFKVKIGEDEPLRPEDSGHKISRYYEIESSGIANHSGATPMGPENRADGLVWASKALEEIIIKMSPSESISVGNISVDSGAMNKIPGRTSALIRLSADNDSTIEETLSKLQFVLDQQNDFIKNNIPTSSDIDAPLKIRELEAEEAPIDESFFNIEKVIDRQKSALMLIKAVEEICSLKSDAGVVGTIGSYDMDDKGVINLLLDIRGIKKEPRESAIEEIQRIFTNYFRIFSNVNFGDRLQGSADPIMMHPGLINALKRDAYRYEVGSVALMDSKATHDAANSGSAGVASALFFVPSRGGIAHNPNAYTAPDKLEKGARLLGAAALILSRNVESFEYLPIQNNPAA